MKGCVYVAPEGISDDEVLGEWLEMARAFVREQVLDQE
jgi:hypothetical protein